MQITLHAACAHARRTTPSEARTGAGRHRACKLVAALGPSSVAPGSRMALRDRERQLDNRHAGPGLQLQLDLAYGTRDAPATIAPRSMLTSMEAPAQAIRAGCSRDTSTRRIVTSAWRRGSRRRACARSGSAIRSNRAPQTARDLPLRCAGCIPASSAPRAFPSAPTARSLAPQSAAHARSHSEKRGVSK